jgi:anti-sigma regulatory factor (Ser/Thr protein kinase)
MREVLEIKLTNQLSEIGRFNQAFTEFGRRHRLAPKILHDVNLAVEEILANIISYGYSDNREEHEIKVGVSVQPGEVRVDVEDDGRPFNPLEAPEPDTTKPLEERTVGGLGIHLVRKLMDSLEYKRRDDRNLLIIKKNTQEF